MPATSFSGQTAANTKTQRYLLLRDSLFFAAAWPAGLLFLVRELDRHGTGGVARGGGVLKPRETATRNMNK